MGVWIETYEVIDDMPETLSLLMWECGLKPRPYRRLRFWHFVTPYVGVWIETAKSHRGTGRG